MGRFKIQLITKGKGIQGFALDFNKKIKNVEVGLKVLGQQAADHMGNTINSNSKHGTGKLGGEIKVYETGDGVGVGNVEYLKKAAPYWYVLNYGRTIDGGEWIPPANRGYFEGGSAPIAGGGNEKWVHTGNTDDFIMYPKKYTPINYIEQMKAWMNSTFRARTDNIVKSQN